MATVPPLRSRREDIPVLVRHIISELAQQHQMQEKTVLPETIEVLKKYDWPGNVRELQNVVERMMYIPPGGEIVAEALLEAVDEQNKKENDIDFKSEKPIKEIIIETEEDLIIRLKKECEGNLSMMSRKMGISRNTLYKKLKQYGLEV